MSLLGYAQVLTDDQVTARQLDKSRAAECTEILEEHASGGDRSRPVLAQTPARLRRAIRRPQRSAELSSRSLTSGWARFAVRCYYLTARSASERLWSQSGRISFCRCSHPAAGSRPLAGSAGSR